MCRNPSNIRKPLRHDNLLHLNGPSVAGTIAHLTSEPKFWNLFKALSHRGIDSLWKIYSVVELMIPGDSDVCENYGHPLKREYQIRIRHWLYFSSLWSSYLSLAFFQTFRSEEPSNEILQKILSYRWQAVKKEEARNTWGAQLLIHVLETQLDVVFVCC